MIIIDTRLNQGIVSCIAEHNGFFFELSIGFFNQEFFFKPDLTDIHMRGAVIKQDKSFMKAYSYIVENYNKEDLWSLWGDLHTVGCILKKGTIWEWPHCGHIDNDSVLDIIENELIHQSIKNKMLDNCEWVYLVGNEEEGKYKIGMTRRSPKKRINEFSPLLPFRTKIYALCPTLDAYALEKELHGKFKDSQTNGEWFNLSKGDVVYIKSLSI